jgi:hypothetical protein
VTVTARGVNDFEPGLGTDSQKTEIFIPFALSILISPSIVSHLIVSCMRAPVSQARVLASSSCGGYCTLCKWLIRNVRFHIEFYNVARFPRPTNRIRKIDTSLKYKIAWSEVLYIVGGNTNRECGAHQILES